MDTQAVPEGNIGLTVALALLTCVSRECDNNEDIATFSEDRVRDDRTILLMATVDKPSLFSFTVDHWITEGYCRRHQ